MQLALAEAAKGGSATWKNPQVGAVIVKDGQLLATGYHHQYGQAHAERDASVSFLTNSWPGPRFTSPWSPAFTTASSLRVVSC